MRMGAGFGIMGGYPHFKPDHGLAGQIPRRNVQIFGRDDQRVPFRLIANDPAGGDPPCKLLAFVGFSRESFRIASKTRLTNSSGNLRTLANCNG